jgi:hypothetical protein
LPRGRCFKADSATNHAPWPSTVYLKFEIANVGQNKLMMVVPVQRGFLEILSNRDDAAAHERTIFNPKYAKD